MRYLWIVSAAMLVGGIVLTLAGLLAISSPIAIVAGALLAWSGIIKVIILRIWRLTLPHAGGSLRAVSTGTSPAGKR